MRNTFFFLLFFIVFGASGQEKKVLSLNDAVLKQGTELRPMAFNGIGWNGENYLYIEGKQESQKLIELDGKSGKSSDLMDLKTFQSKFPAGTKELKKFPHFSVVKEGMLFFQHEGQSFVFDMSKDLIASFGEGKEGVSDVHVNRDGNALAFVMDNNVYLDPIGTDAVKITTDGNEDLVYGKAVSRLEFGISEGIFWAPSGNALAFYRNDQSQVPSYPLVNLDSTPAALNGIKYPMAGGPSEKVSVMVHHRGTGKTILLATDSKSDEDAYICSVNWSPDEREILLVLLNRDQNHMRINSYDAVTGAMIRNHYQEKDQKYVEPLYPLFFTGKTSEGFIFFSQRNGFMHAYKSSFGKQEQLTSGAWVVTGKPALKAEGKYLFFEGTSENATENHIYKLDTKSGKWSQVTKEAGQHTADINHDGSKLIDTWSSLSIPNTVRLLDDGGKQIAELLKADDPLQNYQVSRPEILTIKAHNGVELYARMIKPHDFDPKKKYPVLVYVYNGPHVQLIKNSWWASAPYWMNAFAEKGYLVFTVDGHGSYNRGKNFEQVIFRQLGTPEMMDQLAGVSYLKSLPYVDGERLAVHGWSYGGFMTTSLMLRNPGVFKVGVAGGPVTNWKYYEVMYTERYMDTPKSNPEGYKNNALTEYTKDLKGKLLLIHGLVDDVVVPQQNFTLIKKFVDDGVQVDFFPYPGHPHNVRGKDRLHLMKKVLDYVEVNL